MILFFQIISLLCIIKNWPLGINAIRIVPEDCGYYHRCGIHNLTATVQFVQDSNKDTLKNEYPMLAWLKDKTSTDCFRCPAAIISTYYVLVAASCLLKRDQMGIYLEPKEIAIVVGDWLLSPQPLNLYTTYFARKIVIHADFDPYLVSQRNNIALIQAYKPIAFNAHASPVCLPFSAERFNAERPHESTFEGNATALGWSTIDLGNLRIPGGYSQKATVEILPHKLCTNKFRESGVRDKFLCINFSQEEARRLVCRGWSGGLVLQANSRGAQELVGFLMSEIKDCDLQTVRDTITRIRSHLVWILKNTPGALFCQREEFVDTRKRRA